MKERIEKFLKEEVNLKAYCGYKWVVAMITNDYKVLIALTKTKPDYDELNGWMINFEEKTIFLPNDIEASLKDELNNESFIWEKRTLI